jgi:hypothetical protein
MRSSSCGWLAVGGLVLIAACSSASKPAALGDCTGDGGCAYGGSGGGGSGGSGGGDDAGGDDGGACTVSSTQSQCNQCQGTTCCSQLDTCGASTPCQNVIECVDACSTASCQAGCPQQFPGEGATLYQSLLQCVTNRCTVCAQLGVGDPCWDTTTACNAGFTCGGQWCTKTCSASSQCTGLGANGGNYTGNPNVCRHISAGDYCFPGCASDADCSGFPTGTYCVQTTAIDGTSVAVCAAGPDGGLE